MRPKHRFFRAFASHLLLIVLLLFAHSLVAQTEGMMQLPVDTAEENKTRAIVLQKVTQLNRSLLNRDSIRLDGLLADDVSYTHSNGLTQTKAEVIRSIMSRQHDYRKIHPRNEQIRVVAQSAVVNLDAEVSLVLDGKPLELDLQIVQIWMKQDDGDWKLIARQSSLKD